MDKDRIWVVDSGFACGGLVIRNHKVLICAPIFRKWFQNRTTGTVKQLIRNRNWKLVEVT